MNPARSRFWDFPSALLLALAIQAAGQRLTVTAWTSSLGAASLLAFGATVLGLALGWSRFRRGTVALVSLLYTLVLVPFLLAGVSYPQVPWLERMASVIGRLGYAVSVLASRQPLEDAFVFQLVFLLGFWLVGLYSGYALTGFASFAGAALPSGAALLVIQLFDPLRDRGVAFMAVYIFLALFLLGRMNYARRRDGWKTWRVFSSGEARADINFAVLLGALLLVLTAWLLPVSERGIPLLREWWQDVADRWQKNAGIANVTASLQTGQEIEVTEFYGRSLALGQEASLSDAVLFRIQTAGMGNQERYYWRVRSYDTYVNGAWETGAVNLRSFSSSSRSLELPGYEGVNAEFEFNVESTAIGVLVTPPRPIWVSRPSTLSFFPAGEALEPLLFQTSDPILPGEEYTVHAILMEPTEKQLRAAGTDYPAWVSERYLQLPADLPPAIPALAQEVTAGAATPYDAALAVTRYLRTEITYSLSVPPAPVGRDTLAWFLFDYKKGFCNYYATAEVILLRSLGIPARLAVGFAEGEYEAPGWYIVLQRDAHAWPEVYFPGVGWVEFEPTTSEPELARPSGEATPTPEAGSSLPVTPRPEEMAGVPSAAESPISGGAGGGSGGGGFNSLGMLLTFFAVVLLFGSLLAWAYISGALEKGYRFLRETFDAPAPILARNWLEKNSLPVPPWLERQAWLAGLTPLARAFMTVYRCLRLPPRPVLTPAEAAAALAERLPQAASETSILISEYQVAFYGMIPGDLEKVRQAERSLRRKARRARWQGLLRRQKP
jgi:transglutaminase-like putative cysteine protease